MIELYKNVAFYDSPKFVYSHRCGALEDIVYNKENVSKDYNRLLVAAPYMYNKMDLIANAAHTTGAMLENLLGVCTIPQEKVFIGKLVTIVDMIKAQCLDAMLVAEVGQATVYSQQNILK